jgi:hypothetical protein
MRTDLSLEAVKILSSDLENSRDRIGAECPEIFENLAWAEFFQILIILSSPPKN